MDVFSRERVGQLLRGSALVVPLSFFPTLARSAFLSYFLILLAERFDLSVDQIGLFFGGFILLSSVSSLGFGPVLDKLSLKTLMLASSIIQSAMYLSLFIFNSLILAFILCLVLNLAYLSMETAVRVCISRLFHAKQVASVLSLKYTFTDAAYALGPLAGLWLNRQGVSPLLFSSAVALVFILICARPFSLQRLVDPQNIQDEGLFDSLALMAKDRNLLRFTVASILLAGVFGQFHMYMGQYLLTLFSTQRMYEIINVVFVTNALTSIMLQYLIGRRVAAERFRSWICGCILAFLIGLTGFAFSSNLYAWVFFTAIFTVGEIIIHPLEFLYIARIAPPHKIGAYYTSQNLAYLGAASTPMICGFILASFNPVNFLLYLLVLLLIGGGIFYVEAGKVTQPPSFCS